MQPETLQSLINRLNQFTLTKEQFKDIQIKSAELIKQLFPFDSAGAEYQINMLLLTGKSLYEAKTELISILEARLQTIIRAEQIQQQKIKDLELQNKKIEEIKSNTNKIQDNDYILRLQKDLQDANNHIRSLVEQNETYYEDSKALKIKADKKYTNHRIKDITFWGLIVAICALLFGIGYNFGTNKFDSEKFSLKEQRDRYKFQLDSIKKNQIHLSRSKI